MVITFIFPSELRMTDRKSLTHVLGPWLETQFSDLPAMIRTRIEADFFPMPWDQLSPEQRRKVTVQWDERHDPRIKRSRELAWRLVADQVHIEGQIAELQRSLTPTSIDIAKKETRLAELQQDLAQIDWKLRHAPMVSPAPAPQYRRFDSQIRYAPFPIAFEQLRQRLDATREELAAWIFVGPGVGGIAAYHAPCAWTPQPLILRNTNEFVPSQRFFFDIFLGDDYVAPLMSCWFDEDEILAFKPRDRFITGLALIKRWQRHSHIKPEAFISAKIAESRLIDIHPILGRTQAGFPEHHWLPPAESGLFPLGNVESIEAEDFDINPAASEPKRGPGRPRDPSALSNRIDELREDAIAVARNLGGNPKVDTVVAQLVLREKYDKWDSDTIRRQVRQAWWQTAQQSRKLR